jgi:hypothetical protein
MNTSITGTELETLTRSIGEELREAKRLIRLRIGAACTGRTVEFTHREDDPADPNGVIATPVQAQVTGARWTYEDEMLLEITYPHPRTGEAMVATRYLMM